MRPILDGPVHTTTNATQRESSLGWRCRWQVARMQLSYDPLIETAVRTVRTDVVAKLQLPTLQRDGRINACLVQSFAGDSDAHRDSRRESPCGRTGTPLFMNGSKTR